MEKHLVLLAQYTELRNNWFAYCTEKKMNVTLQEVKDFGKKEQELKNEINYLGFYIFCDSTKTVNNWYNLKSISTNLPIN